MSFSTGELARLAGITVRTLHHYDQIGLLSPSERTAAGYRLYTDLDLQRLQRLLCYRELGFDLGSIAELLDDGADPLDHLRRQHEMLDARIEALCRVRDSVKRLTEARKMGINLDPRDMFEVFGDNDPTRHAEEAEQRWGDTDAYRESQRRASSYGREQWLQIREEGEQLNRDFAAAMQAGLPAAGDEAMDLAEQARSYIDRWFYACSYEMHRALGDMYTADPRFAEFYDSRAPGLAAYVREAIHANAARAEGPAA